MPGAVSQLISKGIQDESLTDLPEITFYEAVYQQYVDFAVESIQHSFQGTPNFGRTNTVELTRTGDMITRMLLEVTLPAITPTGGTSPTFRWAPYIGQTAIRYATLEIGSTTVDKQYGLWMNVWTDLSVKEDQRRSHLEMIGQQVVQENISYAGGIGTATYSYSGLQTPKTTHAETKVYVPLKFWFDEPGLALPIIAMPFAPVRVKIEFRTYADLWVTSGSPTGGVTGQSLVDTTLWVDHIFVDNDERQRIVDEPHEYLICQNQFPGENVVATSTTSVTQKLNLNHPVKALYWFYQRDAASDGTGTDVDWVDYTDTNGLNCVSDYRVKINNQDRNATRDGVISRHWFPYYHHSHCPRRPGINMMSFALYPEDFQPSGSLNFSRVDNPELVLTLTAASTSGGAGKLYIFAVNLNTFRVANGTAGLGFAA